MIKAIFAIDSWGGMGYRGSLPWPHSKEDLQHFKTLTSGQIVVMGRKTYDDPKMPKPLPGRTSYVITHRPIKGVLTINGDINQRLKALESYYTNKTIWVIGGPEILLETKDLIKEAHVTHFKAQYKSDVQLDTRGFFSTFQARSAKPGPDWTLTWMVYKNIDIFTE